MDSEVQMEEKVASNINKTIFKTVLFISMNTHIADNGYAGMAVLGIKGETLYKSKI